MKKPLSTCLLCALALSLVLTACQKNNDTQPTQPDLVVTDDHHQTVEAEEDLAATLFDDSPEDFFTMTLSEETTSTHREARQGLAFCGAILTLSVLPNGNRQTVIDYGAGQTCKDGKTRAGKLFIVASPGREFTQTITFENYTVNARSISGTQTVMRVLNGSGLGIRTRSENLKITTKDGVTITFTSEKTRTYDRKGTLTPEDDEISILGSSSGVGSDGKTFSSLITKAIVFKNACGRQNHVPVSGILDLMPAGRPKRTIEYGDGTCDKIYAVTSDGQTVTKTFK